MLKILDRIEQQAKRTMNAKLLDKETEAIKLIALVQMFTRATAMALIKLDPSLAGIDVPESMRDPRDTNVGGK